MSEFIHDHFLLRSQPAQQLYHEIAKNIPIYDYHCHLDPEAIANNQSFENLAEIWLNGDHYKWRAMRANGIAEEYCSGNADPYEKYLAFAKTLPKALRNPLYHWSHLELKRVFGIDTLLNEESAKEIWEETQTQLKDKSFNVHKILDNFGVDVIGTTDDPVNDLKFHRKIAKSKLATKVYPTFRADISFQPHNPKTFNHWVNQLQLAAEMKIRTLPEFMTALDMRHKFFHDQGCRMSDLSVASCPNVNCSEGYASLIFEKVRKGDAVEEVACEKFRSFMLLFLAKLDAKRDWVRQFRVGSIRNLNSALYDKVGADIGCDSITDASQIDSLAMHLKELSKCGSLPKTILYNLNPATNYALATMAGNFQDSSIAGKIQFGSGWWFLDQKEGMEWQLNTLSNVGLLSHFVGMVTDSRSFMSYPRHEYFRRILCNLIGQDIEEGLIPNDLSLVKPMIEGICYTNAKNYFGMKTGSI